MSSDELIAFESEEFASILYKFSDSSVSEQYFTHMNRISSKNKKQTSASDAIVIDLGSYETRAGFSGELEPRVVIRSLVARAKFKKTNEDADCVGDLIPSTDQVVKMTIKCPFDRQVVVHSNVMEHVLDFVFNALGGIEVTRNFPVVITECLCNPVSCRNEIAALLFERFKVPKVCFAIDSLAALYFNHKLSNVSSLIVCASHEACTILPVYKGIPLHYKACRIDVGAFHCKEFLRKILWLKYPHLKSSLTNERIRLLFEMFCRFAVEYAKEIETLPDDECRTVQFDFEFYEKKEASEDEKAKKLQKKKETTEKLKVLAQERRAAKLEEDKQNLEYFEDLVRKKEESELTESDFEAQIEESGFEDEEDFMKYLKNLKKKLQEREKKSDANANEGDFDEDVSMADKFNLVDVPDEQLTPEQIKEKRRQKLMKAGVDARIRKQEEKHRLEREAQEKKEEQKRQYSENPEEFMGSLLSKRKLLMESREQRKKSKAMLSDRKSDLSKRRIQVLAELGKSMDPDQEVNDSFGARDADWDIYRQVQTNNEEDDQSEDEKTQIRNLEELVRELDPSQLPIEVAEGSQLVPDKKSIARYFQLDMFIERLRAPEAIFQPSMIGVDQAGLTECISFVYARLSEEERNAIMPNVFLCGGLSNMQGLVERLLHDVQMIAPYGSDVRVIKTNNPQIDSWKGLALISALSSTFSNDSISSVSQKYPVHNFGNAK